MTVLCISLYLTMWSQVPIVETCETVPEPVAFRAIGECNRSDRCEWIVTPAGRTELDWTLTDPDD